MNTYRLKVGKNLATTVHNLQCRLVINRLPKQGVWTVTAETAQQAADNWDRDNDTIARKIPATKVCPCCGNQ